MYVIALSLNNGKDLERILKELFDGNVVIANTGELLDKGKITEIQCLVGRLQNEVEKNKWDIAKLGTFRIIITPKDIKVWRY